MKYIFGLLTQTESYHVIYFFIAANKSQETLQSMKTYHTVNILK